MRTNLSVIFTSSTLTLLLIHHREIRSLKITKVLFPFETEYNWYDQSDDIYITVVIKSVSYFVPYNHPNSSKVQSLKLFLAEERRL